MSDSFVVFFVDDVVVDVQLFDSSNKSHLGRTIVDFDTLKLSVPNWKDFLKGYKESFDWKDYGITSMGG